MVSKLAMLGWARETWNVEHNSTMITALSTCTSGTLITLTRADQGVVSKVQRREKVLT